MRDKDAIANRVAQIRGQIEETKSEFDKEKLQERLAKLAEMCIRDSICDREDEINAFIPEEYWSLEGDFQVKGEKKPLQAKFYGTDKKMDIHSKEEMDKLLASLKDKEYEINEVKKGERIKLSLIHIYCCSDSGRCGNSAETRGRDANLFFPLGILPVSYTHLLLEIR